MKHYSNTEIKTIRKALKSDDKKSVIAKRLSEELNRPFGSVYLKMIKLSTSRNSPGKRAWETRRNNLSKNNAINVPNGLTYNGVAKKVEIHSDHFKIYF